MKRPHGDDLYVGFSIAQLQPGYCLSFSSRGTDRARIDQQRVPDLFNMRFMCVTKDNDVCRGVEPCQTTDGALVKAAVIRQLERLCSDVQTFEEKPQQSRTMPVNEYNVMSGKL